MDSLNRFLQAQENIYSTALQEIKNGKKESHWMWYIFPQLKSLGISDMSDYYGITDLNEARKYFLHPVLGKRLIEISKELLRIRHDDIDKVFYYPDNLKLHSCMTLFYKIAGPDSIFDYVLGRFFKGELDRHTLDMIKSE